MHLVCIPAVVVIELAIRDLEDPCGELPEEEAIMAHDQRRSFKGLQGIFQELPSWDVQMVRGLIQHQQRHWLQEELSEGHPGLARSNY